MKLWRRIGARVESLLATECDKEQLGLSKLFFRSPKLTSCGWNDAVALPGIGDRGGTYFLPGGTRNSLTGVQRPERVLDGANF